MGGSSLYFGFGSNLWLDQMNRRCPASNLIGFASLSGWKWIINDRGYANIIPSDDDIVYGLVYKLIPEDEMVLDGFEGVPFHYTKKIMLVDLTEEGADPKETSKANVLVYVDIERVKESPPQQEYVHRMNMGIADGITKGIPREYFDKYLRKFIPDELKN